MDACNEYKKNLLTVAQLSGFLCNDEVFKKEHGFSMTEYIDERCSCAKEIREVAGSIDTVVTITGAVRTGGGVVGVVGGAAALGGLVLAPFTAGLSLGFTITGVVLGLAAGGTGLGATIGREVEIRRKAKVVKNLLDSLQKKEEVVCRVINELQVCIKKMQSLSREKSVIDFVKDGMNVINYIKKSGYIAYKVVSVVKAVRLATAVARFIQADFYALKGIAVVAAAPGLRISGRVVIMAGATTAKVVAGTLGVVGIGAGVWDIVGGAKDIIFGAEEAKAYKKVAEDMDKQTEEYVGLLKTFSATDDDEQSSPTLDT